MAEHPDCALVRRGYEAFSSGDWQTLSEMLAVDAVHHVPGNHPLSGHHKGRDACLALYRHFGEETEGTFRVTLRDLFADGRGHVVAVHEQRADRHDRGMEIRGALFFTIVGGKITDIDELSEDIDAENEFWAA